MTSKRIKCKRLRKRVSIEKHNEVHRRTRRSKLFHSAGLRENLEVKKCPNLPVYYGSEKVYLNHSKPKISLKDKQFTENGFHFSTKRSLFDRKEALARADQNSLANCEKKSFLSERQLIKIMLILIVLSVGFLFGSALCSFGSDNLESLDHRPNHLDGANSRLPTREDSFVAQKYSASNNSNLFYDLSLTNSDVLSADQARKPIYFHFISNKPIPSEPIHSKTIHSSSKNGRTKNVHKHFNRHRSFSSHQAYLQRFMLANDTIKCNDGTNAGYYFRRGKNKKKWIVFLEGGWFCYSTFSCNHQRWVQMRNLMTSAHLPERKLVNGILSNKRDENPFYYNANHVYLPYCSSDSWSGDRPARSNKDLHFSGSKIIENVIKDLIAKGLHNASSLYLAGSSAGGTGVMMNLDRIADLVKSINPKTVVRGLIDSGWFLDNEPFKSPNSNQFFLARKLDKFCLDGQLCSPVQTIEKGFKFWNGQVPDSCRSEYPNEPWKCYFGHRIYRSLRTPIFVIQYLFDEAQLTADNVAIPTSKSHWHYVYKMGLQMRDSLKNVTGLFSPSCISHTMLTKRSWNQIRINGISLPEAIKCWEMKQNLNKFDSNLHQKASRSQSNALTNEVDIISPSLHPSNYYYSSAYSNVFNVRETNSIFNQLFNRSEGQNRTGLQSKSRSSNRLLSDSPADESLSLERCSLRLMDECTLPQCNVQCPKLKNILTGKEINFFDLLKAFGLKVKMS